MTKVIATCIAALTLSTACTAHFGTATMYPDGKVECEGIDLAVGDSSSCATHGGQVSKEFAQMIEALAALAKSILPGG